MANQQESLSDLYEQTVASNTLVLASINKLVKDVRVRTVALANAHAEIDRLKAVATPSVQMSGDSDLNRSILIGNLQGELSAARATMKAQQEQIEKLKANRKRNAVR